MLQLLRTLKRFATGQRPFEGFLLDTARLELSAAAERMRVDRNGSVVSMLIIEPALTKNSPQDIHELERMMATRLRLTDTAGWLRDGRVAILLPDTPAAGIWKVAADLCEAYEVGADRPSCEVVVYPERPPCDKPPHDDPPSAEDERHDTEEPVLNGSGVPSNGAPLNGNAPNGEATSSIAAGESETDRTSTPSPFEAMFIHPLPTWKRALDLVGASVGLLIATPVIAVAAVAIRLTTGGSAFFSQEREGLGGHRFQIHKLQTMRPDAEQMKSALRHHSEQDGPAFKIADDPRITPIGRLLRRTSLDELPQLWNVLRGDMSLVGPRPLPIDESLACKPWQRRRLRVTPGLTCIWQIHGRNIVPFDDWIRMDLAYAERRSPWLDLKLVAQTGPTLLLQKGR